MCTSAFSTAKPCQGRQGVLKTTRSIIVVALSPFFLGLFWLLISDQTDSWSRAFKQLSLSLAAAPFTFSQLLRDLVQNIVDFSFYKLGFHLGHVLVHLLQVDRDVSQLFMSRLQHMVRWPQGMGFCLPASLTHWMCWKRTCRQGETMLKIQLPPLESGKII